MTKRNLTLGTASGKLGSVVYFRRRGQQIARVLVSQVNDKKTLSQCYVRGRFANYVNLWRLLRPYVEDSWRGVSRYGSPENAFSKHNKGFIPVESEQMSREGYAFPNFGLVTYGSLPVSLSLDYDSFPAAVGSANQNGAWLNNVVFDGLVQSVADLSNALISSGTGIREGDILHILAYTYSFDPTNFRPSYALELPPRVYHYAINIDKSSNFRLDVVAPKIKWMKAVGPPGQNPVGAWIVDSLWLDDSGDYSLGCFFTMYVERPSNPRYSRFSRSRFVMQSAERFYLYPMANSTGGVGQQYAVTWQSV